MQNGGRTAGLIFLFLLLSFVSSSTMPSKLVDNKEPAMELKVPISRQDKSLGMGSICIEFGAPYDPKKPVLFVIADAQQFYVKHGAVASIQKELFNQDFNVAGIIGRGTGREFINAAMTADGKPDWARAYTVFNSSEWVEDIEAARKAVVGNNGKILLYGRSGGAFLIHQYLAKHGAHAERAVSLAAPSPFLVKELGLNSDHFWKEIGEQDPELHGLLKQALVKYSSDKPRLIMTIQRQNFFVPPDRLQQARADLIRALAAGNDEAYKKAREEFQVEEVASFFNSPEGVSIRVRLYEFALPEGILEKLSGEAVYPDLENLRAFAEPLLELNKRGIIPAPSWNKAALHSLKTETFVVSGVLDHTVDYRASIALASLYPKGVLFLADDDHVFHSMNEDGTMNALVQSFLLYGEASPEYLSALAKAEKHRWRE